jgi:phenylpropionate dioxygenase-like ring-hydroxylating dioxygenase large terminal subunit
MIPNQWYAVLESKEVKRHPVGVLRLGERLVFWRDSSGRLSCLRDQCSHRGAKLSLGEVCEGKLQCPFHGLLFSTDGKCMQIPANGRNNHVPANFNLAVYPVHEEYGWIFIYNGHPLETPKPPSYFADLPENFPSISKKDFWNIHYTRCVENQLDVSHLPFVHRRTIGRGNASLVDGPKLVWTGPLSFDVYVFNRRDDGTLPRKADELPVKDTGSQKLEFIFPNLWQNYLTPGMRIVAAFVPVDEEHSLIYLRFHLRFMQGPLMKFLIRLFFMPFNMRILHEDRKVVLTQLPRSTALHMQENLFQADMPIIEYRKKRHELLQGTP